MIQIQSNLCGWSCLTWRADSIFPYCCFVPHSLKIPSAVTRQKRLACFYWRGYVSTACDCWLPPSEVTLSFTPRWGRWEVKWPHSCRRRGGGGDPVTGSDHGGKNKGLPPKPPFEPEARRPFICISMRNLITAQRSDVHNVGPLSEKKVYVGDKLKMEGEEPRVKQHIGSVWFCFPPSGLVHLTVDRDDIIAAMVAPVLVWNMSNSR